MKHSSTTASAATLTYVFVDAAAHRAGFRLDVQFETHSPGSIRELVNAGLGVALVAQSVADAPGPPVGVHQPQPAEAHPPIALIRRRDRPLSAAARQLSDELNRAGPAVISDLPSPQGDKSKITNSERQTDLRMAALCLDHSTAATAARSSGCVAASAAFVVATVPIAHQLRRLHLGLFHEPDDASASSIGNPGV
jgi:hypothetical protein